MVSASSDRTIKLWNPHSLCSNSIHTLGNHADFVKCLASSDAHNWVASAGFDRKVSLWDLNETRSSAILTFTTGSQQYGLTGGHQSDSSPKTSIYALATNVHGNILATGSPEKVVRLWDPKSGKRITKLTGHTDNIRALLISDDGQFVSQCEGGKYPNVYVTHTLWIFTGAVRIVRFNNQAVVYKDFQMSRHLRNPR